MKKISLILSNLFVTLFCSVAAFASNFLPLPDDVIDKVLGAGDSIQLTVQKDATDVLLATVTAVKTDPSYTKTDATDSTEKFSDYQDYQAYYSEANNTTYYIYKEENKLYPGYARLVYTENDEQKKATLDVHTNISNELLSFEGSTDYKLNITANLKKLAEAYDVKPSVSGTFKKFNDDMPATSTVTIQKDSVDKLKQDLASIQANSKYTKTVNQFFGLEYLAYSMSDNNENGFYTGYYTPLESSKISPDYVRLDINQKTSHASLEVHTQLSDDSVSFNGSNDNKISLDLNLMNLLAIFML